jgi:hypothetical protein
MDTVLKLIGATAAVLGIWLAVRNFRQSQPLPKKLGEDMNSYCDQLVTLLRELIELTSLVKQGKQNTQAGMNLQESINHHNRAALDLAMRLQSNFQFFPESSQCLADIISEIHSPSMLGDIQNANISVETFKCKIADLRRLTVAVNSEITGIRV